MTNSREILWKEYYAAMRAGDAERAKLIIKKLHSPPGPSSTTNNPNGSATRAGGCRRCRRTI